MYIAIRPFIQQEDKILIFDTSDISTEYISTQDFTSNLTIDNSDVRPKLCGELLSGWKDNDYVHWTSGIFNAIRSWDKNYEHGREYRFGQFCFSGAHRWEFGEFKVTLGFGDRFSKLLEINDIKIPCSERFATSQQTPHYAFKYKDVLVLRFCYATFSAIRNEFVPEVLTIMIDRYGVVVSAYNNEGVIFGDNSLAMSVSMLCVY